jgi:hypothetical protein
MGDGRTTGTASACSRPWTGGDVHGLTRDPANDYGMDWLGLHYQEGNPRPG